MVRAKFRFRVRKKIFSVGVRIPKKVDIEHLKHTHIHFKGSWQSFRDGIYKMR